jgi:hypothetical protein
MTLSARASQARQETGAPHSCTAVRDASDATDVGAQIRTTPSEDALAMLRPPGENEHVVMGASCPASHSCTIINCLVSAPCTATVTWQRYVITPQASLPEKQSHVCIVEYTLHILGSFPKCNCMLPQNDFTLQLHDA